MISRPIRDHLSRLNLVYALVQQIKRTPEAYALCKADTDLLRDAHESCKCALLDHIGVKYDIGEQTVERDGITPAWDAKTNTQLFRHEVHFRDWVKAGMSETVDACEWITAVLDQSKTQQNILPENLAQLRNLWDVIQTLIFRIYSVFDCDLENTEAMHRGVRLSMRMTI